MSATTAESAAPHKGPMNDHTNNPKKDGDEEVEGGVSGSDQEFIADPAILAVLGSGQPMLGMPPIMPSTPEFRYSREYLLKLRNAPLSQRRHEVLNPADNNSNGVWDPENWHHNNKNSSTRTSTSDGGPNENGSRNDSSDHKRRPGDPRERIRKEQDGIVLSPQRRSFNSGCFVPLREPIRSNRPLSPLGKEPAHLGHRDIYNPAPRRIGSGRILPWDFQDKPDTDNDPPSFRRDRREPADREDRFERKSFGHFDVKSGRNNNNYNNRFSNRRISNESREEEPEWFSSGPISQNDTIELRGFDESEKVGGAGGKKKATQKKKKEQQQNNNNNQKTSEKMEESGSGAGVTTGKKGKTTPAPQDGATLAASKHPKSPVVEKDAAGDGPHISASNPANDTSFNFEDILKCDSIPGLLSNGTESGDAAGSKFSRWFKRDKSPPTKPQESRRSSLQDQDHHHLIKNLLSEPSFNEPSVTIPQPGDSESYFAPISPAASSMSGQKSMNLMEMLQRGNKMHADHHHQHPPSQMKGMDVPSNIMSLEELEAHMMQGAVGKHQPKQEEDVNAFKRLVSGLNHHVNNGPIPQKPMSIMEMLTHSQQQDEARMANQRINQNLPPNLVDINYKLQQVANQAHKQPNNQDLVSKFFNAGIAQQARASPLQEMGINQSRELLNRPEAQAILQGLKRGDITPQHLYQQLANHAMQPRHRELLMTIIKLQVAGSVPQQQQPPQGAASPVNPPHPMYQQQLRVSPLPPNAMHQRIPSPRELQVHTQNIMQRALIKKKLEEQEENFRKKQAQQRGTSPAKTASPTPLAFTPTSVLRKMTADKDDGSKDGKGDSKLPQGRAVTGMRAPQSNQQQPQLPQQQQPPNWSQFSQQLKQPGRPIVKANNNYQPSQQQQAAVVQQQQEQYFQQQRLLQQQRKNQQTFGPPSFSTQQNQYPQLSQQQMRAQHQNVRAQHQQQQPPYQQPQQQQPPQSWNLNHQMLQGQGFDSRSVGRGIIDGGDLSPTSNQLARWFSPDLLDRARKGKLPVIPHNAVAPHALSLEEVERQTTPVGHN